MAIGFIGFGANKSNPKMTFLTAKKHLEKQRVKIIECSGLWQSPAWPLGEGRPDYINAVVKFEFERGPEAILSILLSIETELGRIRTVPNASRIIDLDLLIYGDETRKRKALELPHPRMLDRAFVLLPLCELEPVWLSELAKLPARDIEAMKYRGRW